MKWLIPFVINAVALLVADYLIKGIYLSGIGPAILAAVALGLINTLIRPVLIVLTLPLSLLTLGLFILVINAITFGLASLLVPGFHVDSFGAAFLGAILTSIVSWFLNMLLRDR